MMTGTTETTAPANMLTDSAHHYLDELDYGARKALLDRDAARIADRAQWLAGREETNSTRGPGSACNSPIHLMQHRRHRDLSDAAARAEETVGFVADWYARAAMAACRAILTGQTVTARDLERASLQRHTGPDLLDGADTSSGPAWRAQYRPELPASGELDTGHHSLDRPVHTAREALLAAYAAACTAEALDAEDARRAEENDPHEGEPTGLADWEASELSEAEVEAATVPDRLIAWAAAVTHAAVYGRSIAYGHQPAE